MIELPQAASAEVYADFDGLAQLKARARAAPDAALREVAEQFEALFLQMMLASMRDASLGEGILDSKQSLLYRDMLDKQLGVTLAKDNGIGLADVLVRQLGPAMQRTAPAPDGSPPGGSAPLATDDIDRLAREDAIAGAARSLERRVPSRPAVATPASSELDAHAPEPLPRRASEAAHVPHTGAVAKQPAAVDAKGPRGVEPSASVARFSSPQHFVNTLWKHAEQAARELGTPPEALIAQAALESGWGKAVARRADGSSTHNLFGIKADRRWDGERLVQSTMEFDQGIAIRTKDAFRVYESYAQSFGDYVDFLRANPRYTHALERAGDPEAFFAELQAAGYATDPRYAAKLSSVLNGDAMRDALATME